MALADVQTDWPQFRMLIRVVYTGINSPDAMNSAIANIGPFKVNNPDTWDDWLHAYGFLFGLDQNVQVTDLALSSIAQFVVASNIVAALTAVSSPSDSQVQSLISQMNVVNGYIKQDQRFQAALTISQAVVGQISTLYSA